MTLDVVYHFSEDASIEHFEPHVPRTNPTQKPAVWAIDAEHAPLYWFPRDCPRATAWPRNEVERPAFEHALGTSAPRVHVIEYGRLARLRSTELYRYDFSAALFEPWSEATGQWISHDPVEPMSVRPVGDLLERHASAGIELRVVSDIWPSVRLMSNNEWGFSHVRLANAIGERSL